MDRELVPAPAGHTAGRCVAVLIGIDRYHNGIPPLRNAVRDARAVAHVLREQHGYSEYLLLDTDATLAGIRLLLARLATDLSVDTRLLLYFAGHGIAEETDQPGAGPQGFLIPQDAHRDEPRTFLPMSEVQELLSKLPCRHLLLLLDCCFAGAFRWSRTRSLRPRPATLYRERYERYLRDPAWQVIASAAADERALDVVLGGKLGRRDTEQDHSPFAAALCRGLSGAADLRVDGHPGDGVIVANELHLYLETAFERLEQQLGRPLQKPLLWSLDGKDKGQFLFFVPGRAVALQSALELIDKHNPYQGLQAYSEEQAGLFFGRADVVQQLLQQVQTQPLTVVSGLSGSGKSSVVRAGLMSALRSRPEWHVLPLLRPGNRPLSALASLRSQLAESEVSDLPAALSTWRRAHPEARILLAIDQLEELVTMGASPDEQKKFLDEVQRTLVTSSEYLHVVMTLRSEFEPHFVDLLRPKSGANLRYLVRPLTRPELREVIERPASERVMYFDPPTLVDQLIDEVAEMPGALPLLSFTLSELYRAYVRSDRGDRCLTAGDYQALGGVAGALSQRADEISASLDATHQATLRRLMLRMVSLQAGEVARRRVPLSELSYGAKHPEEARKETVLKRLTDARLVVAGTDSEGTPYVEPAHDKLVLGWPQLWSFIKQEQENLPLQHLLTQEAAAWAQNQRPADLLWSANPRLPLALALGAAQPQRWNSLEAEFLAQSDRRRRRRRQVLVAVIASVILVLTTLTAFAWNAQKKERDERERAETQTGLAQKNQVAAMQAAERASLARQDAERRRKEAEEQKERAENEKQRADTKTQEAMRLLSASYVEQGRQLLLEKDAPTHAALWLQRALDAGSQDPMLPFLLSQAMRPIDSTEAILVGHRKSVLRVAYSPDGQRILTSSSDGSARIWDARTGHPLLQLGGELACEQFGATYGPDGQNILVSPCTSCRIENYSAVSGRLLFRIISPGMCVTTRGGTLLLVSDDYRFDRNSSLSIILVDKSGNRAITRDLNNSQIWNINERNSAFESSKKTKSSRTISISPDGRLAIADINAYSIVIRNTDQGNIAFELDGHTGNINDVAFSHDSQRLVSGSADQTARIWDVAGGKSLFELKGHTGAVNSVAYSPDGRYVLTGGDDKTARLWDAKDGTLISVLRGHRDSIWQVAFSPQSSRLLTVSLDRTVRVWELSSAGLLAVFSGHSDLLLWATFSPDGRHVVSASADAMARVWAIDAPSRRPHRVRIKPAWQWRYSPSGQQVALLHNSDAATIWTADLDQQIVGLHGHLGTIGDLQFSPSGNQVLTTGDDGVVRVWDSHNGRLQHEFQIQGSLISQAIFDANGKHVVGFAKPNKLTQWDAHSGRIGSELIIDASDNDSIFIHPSAFFVINDHGNRQRFISVSGGQFRNTELAMRCDSITAMTNNPRKILCIEFNNAHILDTRTARLHKTLSGHTERISMIALDPGGRRIVTGSLDQTARLWDAESGRWLATLKGHTGPVLRAEFSPDGRYVVTTSTTADHTARIWTVDSGKLVTSLDVPYQEHDPAFSPDSRLLVTSDENFSLRVWESSTGRLVAIQPGHRKLVARLGFSPDGRYILSAGYDNSLRIWDFVPETRSPAELARLLRCYSSFRFAQPDSPLVVPVLPQPMDCAK